MTQYLIVVSKLQPSVLLEGEKPRLIDEWQMAPILWDAVRNSVDELHEDGLYILTGSTSIDEVEVMLVEPVKIYNPS